MVLLDRLARRQHGLVTTAQLVGLGWSVRQVSYLVERGWLTAVRQGIYRLCGAVPTWRSSALAAVLAAGEDAVLSHRSAAALWGFIDHHDVGGILEVAAPKQLRLAGVKAHRHTVRKADRTTRDSIPVTTAARTLVDLADTTGATELGRMCDEGLRRRIVTVPRLLSVAEANRGSGRRRLAPILSVLADRQRGYDPGANFWEQRMDRMWEQMGLPSAVRQYRIQVGRRSFRPDRAIVDLKIAVDWNGYDPHGGRSSFDRDSDRRALLIKVGWLPLDFTSRSEPSLICDAVWSAVAQRTAGAAGAAGTAGMATRVTGSRVLP